MGELLGQDAHGFVSVNRSTRKELAAMRQHEVLAREAAQIRARAEAQETAIQEQVRLARADFRMAGVYHLGAQATTRATELDRLIECQSQEGTHLRRIHRSIEETTAIAASALILRYAAGDAT
jgi:hypothetical protein